MFLPGVGSWCASAKASLESDRTSKNIWSNPAQSETHKTRSGCLGFVWGSSEELHRWDVTASLCQGLTIVLGKCILLMSRWNFPWGNGHRLWLGISLCTNDESLLCLDYNPLFSSGRQQLHPLPAHSPHCLQFFFMLAAQLSALPWFRHMETARLCWRKRKQKNWNGLILRACFWLASNHYQC